MASGRLISLMSVRANVLPVAAQDLSQLARAAAACQTWAARAWMARHQQEVDVDQQQANRFCQSTPHLDDAAAFLLLGCTTATFFAAGGGPFLLLLWLVVLGTAFLLLLEAVAEGGLAGCCCSLSSCFWMVMTCCCSFFSVRARSCSS